MIEKQHQRRGEQRRALYSVDERYRYLIEIVWLPERPLLQLIGLNPSTGSELADDPTIRRAKGFGSALGYGGLLMTNVGAFRCTDPHRMSQADDPIGRGNTAAWLASHPAALVIACWGNWGACGRLRRQIEDIRAEFGDKLHAFGLTKARHPAHPLYLRGDTRPHPLAQLEDA